MFSGITILLSVLFLFGTVSTSLAVGKKPSDVWVYYSFNGQAFVPGQSSAGGLTVAMRERVRPVVVPSPAQEPKAVPLPEGTGVLAGICYFQKSGGKLVDGGSYDPCPATPLLVSSGGKPFITVMTDDQGYFIAVLPAGVYTVGSGVAAKELLVERGDTTLIPLRAGKRMVD